MDLHLINRRLKEKYGPGFNLVDPMFRVVFSEEQFEHRKELFRDYVPGTNILLREVNEVRYCKKYSFLEPQYILEKQIRNLNQAVIDTKNIGSHVTYEPFYGFGQDKKGKPKPLIYRAVELLIELHLHPPKPMTPKQMEEADLKQLQEDEKLMLKYLNENEKQTSFGMAVKDGDAIVMPTNYEKDSPLLIEKRIHVEE